MRIIVTGGSGTSGSWQIRGEQLGRAIGATVRPVTRDARGFDVAILVKRPRPEQAADLRRSGAPVVWDIVDAWPQPIGNGWDRGQCLAWLRAEVAAIRPAGIIAASPQMLADCRAEVPHIPSVLVRHHARPGLARNPVREHVAVVGYEGGGYLGDWRARIEVECAARGWRFVVNPADGLASVDILVALRQASGYAARNWKSNVKLANAQGSGTPIICGRENSYAGTGIAYADSSAEFAAALDMLAPREHRRQAAEALYSARPTLEAVANRYLMAMHEFADHWATA